jgi:hypothetical protein
LKKEEVASRSFVYLKCSAGLLCQLFLFDVRVTLPGR